MELENYLKLLRDHSQDLIQIMDSLGKISGKMKVISENLVEVTNEGREVLERAEKVLKKKPQ